MSWVVMGREFYSSWPVRVFQDEGDARAFARQLTDKFEELRKSTDADRAQAAAYGWETTDDGCRSLADDRALREIRALGLDPKAGGLDVSWDAVEVPDEFAGSRVSQES